MAKKKITFNKEKWATFFRALKKLVAKIGGLFKHGTEKVNQSRTARAENKVGEAKLHQMIEEAVKNDDVLAGRIAYDQLYGKQNAQNTKLWKLVYVLSFALILAVILLFALGRETKIYPVIVKVDGNNQILDVEQAANINYRTIEPEIYTYWVMQFVKNARAISIDGQYQKSLLNTAYAFTQGNATKTLQTFIEARDPYTTAQREVITVQINSVIPNIGGSAHTTQVEWTEIAKDPKTDQVMSRYQYTGQFTFSQAKRPPKAASIALYNPLGFYITHISWSQNYSDLQ